MNKTERIELIIAVTLIIIFGATLIYARSINREVEEEIIDNTVSPVKDVNRYFTIDSAISKYVSYVASEDTSSIIKTLNNEYINNNKITEDNLFDYIKTYGPNYRSNTREIYQISSYNNIYKYYAKVRISDELMDSNTIIGFDYFEITIDEESLTFAIEPISEIVYQNKIEEGENNSNE